MVGAVKAGHPRNTDELKHTCRSERNDLEFPLSVVQIFFLKEALMLKLTRELARAVLDAGES